ncbi:MAG TPA: sugar transferase [Patescibacteria group bacterium]|nr:sugar transferase [Patescibacteria group bacterium]
MGIKAGNTPRIFQFVADILASFLSVIIYVFVRNYLDEDAIYIHKKIFDILTIATFLSIFWTGVFWLSGMYKNWYVRSPFDEYFSIIRTTFLGCTAIFFAVFVDSTEVQRDNIRFIIILYWIVLIGAMCTGRIFARLTQKHLRLRKIICVNAILAGTAEKVLKLYQALLKDTAWGYQLHGVLLFNEQEVKKWESMASKIPLPILGTFKNIEQSFQKIKPEELLVAMESPEHERLLEMAAECDERNVTMKIVPDLYETFSGQARTLQIYGAPLIEVNPQLLKPWEEAVKRLLDIVISIFVMIVSMPICIATAIAIKFESKGPVLYSQDRVGRGGSIFRLYKFRSMVTDSEKDGPQWTKVNDPRVTKVGKFIRKTHIDEIPQFWNILKGEMSIVGPRPEQPFYVKKYSEQLSYYTRRLKVKPGLTGWWQVKYTTYVENLDEIKSRLQLDFFYIENISLKLDLEIMVRTVFRVIKGRGQT